MSSSDQRASDVLAEVELVLREHDVDPALAARIRALLSVVARDDSQSWERGSVPGTRVSLDSVSTIGPVRIDATQPARPGAREPERAREAITDRITAPMPASPLLLPLQLLATGGMGEVHRAHDRPLARDLAMKVLHAHLAPLPRMRARFLDEAQITAQLAHPSIPPVHALGELEDGRPYFTMKEVRGRTLAEIIDRGFGPEGASEQRRIEIFQRVCEAAAYAHARGVIHCDLKPLNVMVGTFGEVLVMDWGVARLVTPTGPVQLIEAPVTTTSDAQTSADVAGTPAYMPPEQALGDATQIGPPSDVYALGVMLFELLAGERPYQGGVPTIVFQAAQGVVPPLPRRPETIVDDSLYEIIVKAMRPSPADRYPDASALGEHVARWRDGAIRREKAIAVVRDAAARLEVLAPRRARAAALRARSAEVLAQLASDAGVEAKRDAWAEEDEARALEREVALAGAEVRQLLEAALVHAPELAEPKALLADLAFAEHRDAERRRAWDAAAQHEVRLRAYDLGAYADYLEGRARLVVWTAEPCEARVARYERRDRTLVAVPTGQVMPTPLDVDLPAGSYRVELVAAGRAPVIYPVRLRRRGDWKGERPGAPGPTPVELPRSLDAETEVFVPAGPFELGDDTSATEEPWVEAFVMQRSPVTFRELARFLADRAGARFRRDVLRDGLGLFRADWPAVGLSWEGARAYGEWLSERTGHAWRLPYEIEWEKAARGVDGRSYPWGDEADAAFAHVRTADRASDAPVSVSAFPVDCSPYGARGMAGNVRDWCLDGLVVASSGTEGRTPSGLSSRRVVRGGSYRLAIEAARCTTRSGLPGAQGYRDVGFRLVRKP